MAKGFKFELNRAGVRELLKSAEMEEVVGSYAGEILNRCGADGYVSDTKQMPTRVIAHVSTGDFESMRDNSENNTLLKALR